MTPATRRRSLYTRLMRAFGVYAVLVALVFGGTAAAFLYLVEDRLFDQQLADEAQVLRATHRATGTWPAPRASHLTVHVVLGTLPDDVRAVLAREPWRREIEGTNGRHFHVRALDATPATRRGDRPDAWLVADVSDRLVVRGLRRTLLLTWGIIILGLLGLAFLTARALARRMHRPLATLAAAVSEDALHAPLPLPADTDAEVQRLADALVASHERVAAHVERERAFTRDASHELRTPLSVVQTSTHQVLRDPALSPPSRRLLTLSTRSIAQLQRTIDTLLLLARDAEQRQPVSDAARRATLIRPPLEAVVLEFADALDERGLAVTLDVPRDATLPVGEPILRLLCMNLLGNVLTHAAPGPVAVRVRDGVLELRNARHADASPDGPIDAGHPSGFGLALVHRVAATVGLTVATWSDAAHFSVSLAAAPESARAAIFPA